MNPRIIILATSLLLALQGAPAIAQGPPPHLPAEVLADRADATRLGWLRANVAAEGPVSGGLRFAFPKDFYRGRLFLVGESHGSAAPQVFDIELLAHLNARIGLVDYVAEVDPIQAAHLNRYLETGDEALLDRVFDLWNGGSQWANTAFEAKIRAIRALNAGRPAKRRVRLHGLDAIQDWPLLAEAFTARGIAIDSAGLMAARAPAARARLALAALEPAARPDDAYLVDALRHQADGADREGTIFANYQALRGATLRDRPAYGLWGAAHVMQAPLNGSRYWAARVVDADPSAAVRSIVLYALDSAVQFPVPLPDGVARVRFTEGNVDGPVVKLAGSSTLREASAPGRITVFRVDGPASPYGEGQELVALRSSIDRGLVPADGLPTTRFVQYVGVYRDSDWAPPREGAGRILAP